MVGAMVTLIKGVFIGMAVSIPVGPIGFLCMQYALQRGFLIALIAGFGAALADTLFGAVAGFWLTAVTEWLIAHRSALQLISGLLLCYIGVGALSSKRLALPLLPDEAAPPLKVLLSTFALTLANPLTILAFVALFASFTDCYLCGDRLYVGLIISGVFIGALLWWFALSGGAAFAGRHMGMRGLLYCRRFMGLSLLLFGCIALLFR